MILRLYVKYWGGLIFWPTFYIWNFGVLYFTYENCLKLFLDFITIDLVGRVFVGNTINQIFVSKIINGIHLYSFHMKRCNHYLSIVVSELPLKTIYYKELSTWKNNKWFLLNSHKSHIFAIIIS